MERGDGRVRTRPPPRTMPTTSAAIPPFTLTGGTPLAERLATLTHDLLGAIDADGRLVWTNPAWELVLGWTRATSCRAASYHGLVHPDDLPRVQAAERDVLAARAGARPETELRLRSTAGDYRWFVFSTSYAPGERYVYVSGKDITARKQAEEELRAAEERFARGHRTPPATRSSPPTSAAASSSGTPAPRPSSAHRGRDALGRRSPMLMPERYREAHRARLARFARHGRGAARCPAHARARGPARGRHGVPAWSCRSATWRRAGQRYFTRRHPRRLRPRARPARAARGRGALRRRVRGRRRGLALVAPDGTLLRANRALCELDRQAGARARRPAARRPACTPTTAAPTACAIDAMVAGRTQRLAIERRFLAADGADADRPHQPRR